jgi:hypothetical protein
MALAFRPADESQVSAAELAVVRLREARDLLVHAGSPRAVARVRLALTSAEGAVRHAKCRSVPR